MANRIVVSSFYVNYWTVSIEEALIALTASPVSHYSDCNDVKARLKTLLFLQ